MNTHKLKLIRSFKWPIALISVSIIIYVCFLFFRPEKQLKYIAYIGRTSTTLSKLDYLQQSVFEDFIKNINRSLENYRIEFLIYSIGTEPKSSDSVYKAIAKEKDILFVIDNTFGNDIRWAQHTVKDNNIPVYFINADKNNLDYGTASIFIGNDDNLPNELTAFLRSVLKVNEVNFLSEADYLLHGTFLKAFEDNNITIQDTILLSQKNFSNEESLKIHRALSDKYKSNLKKLPLVINTHAIWGKNIIEYIEKEFSGVEIIGGAYISELKDLKKLRSNSRNQIIIAGEPSDALSKSMLDNLKYYEKKYPDYFNWSNASYFTKRCLTVTEFIQAYLKKNDGLQNISTRSSILFQDSLKNTILVGKDDLYAIDSIGIFKKETSFTNYRAGKFYSLPLHINLTGKKIPNIVLGLDIVNIHNVDINNNTFSTDFFYWLRTDTSFRSYESALVFQNLKQNESSQGLVMEKIENTSLYKLFKVSGTFYNDFSLQDYPLDEQEIKIQVDVLLPADSLKISFDQRSIEQDPSFIKRFNVQGWDKFGSNFTIDNRISKNMRGTFEEDDESSKLYKSLNYRLNIKRKITKPVLEIILPLFFIGLSSIALLFVKDLSFSNVGEVSIGTLLAIITFSIAMAVIVPSADYLTKADWFFWITFFEVL